MVIREWRGRTRVENMDAYPIHFRMSVLPELRSIKGFLGAQLAMQGFGNTVEYLVLTQWASIAAIREFAGDKFEKAVVEAGAIAALDEFDAEARHYEVVDES